MHSAFDKLDKCVAKTFAKTRNICGWVEPRKLSEILFFNQYFYARTVQNACMISQPQHRYLLNFDGLPVFHL